MGSIFNLDNPVWRFIGKLADVVMLNIVCLICCLPIVTIGPAVTALYYVMIKEVRDEESHIFRMFFRSFKLNFKQGLVIWLIVLALGIFFGVDIWFYNKQMQGSVSQVLLVVFMAAFLIYFFTVTYVFPVLSRFDNTIKKTIIYSFILAIRHLPWTLLIVVINVGIFIGGWLTALYPLCGLGLSTFLTAYIFNHIFNKYIPEEKHEDHFGELGDSYEEPEHIVIGAEDAKPIRITAEDMANKRRESVQLDVMEPVMPAKKTEETAETQNSEKETEESGEAETKEE